MADDDRKTGESATGAAAPAGDGGSEAAASADELMALCLASGGSHKEAAAKGNCSERTVRRRLAQPAFKARVSELRGELVARASGLMAEAMTEAAQALRGLLKAESEMARLGAARAIIELGTKLRESVELAERIATLEEQLAGGKPPEEAEEEAGAP